MEYDIVTEEAETLIFTEKYAVHIPDGGVAKDIYATDVVGTLLWEFDGITDTNVYLPSPSDELRSWYFTDSPRVIPSEYGYSANISDEPLQGWDFDNSAMDIYVFLPDGNYRQFCQDYTDLTGKSENGILADIGVLGFTLVCLFIGNSASTDRRIP